jgi:hypothetical protein
VRPRLRLLVIAALALVALAVTSWPASAGAATPTTDPPRRPDTECVSANPPLDCYDSQEFDRSSPEQLLLFGAVVAGLIAIGVVVVRSTRRRDRAERSRASQS